MVPLQLFTDRLGLRSLHSSETRAKVVRWVHVSELADPTPYLRGGELLLLAGTNLRPEESRRYVKRLAETGVVAIGFGVAPVFDEVPPTLVTACTEHDLTLLEIPPHVPFESVVELQHAELVRSETLALKRLSESQGVLVKAACGPSPIRTLIERLAGLLDGWVLVVDRNRDRSWAAGAVQMHSDVMAALDRACESEAPMSATHAAGGRHVEVHRLVGPARSGYAMALSRQGPPSVVDRGIIGVAASALSLLFPDPEPAASLGALGAAAVSGLLRLRSLGASLGATMDQSEQAQWRVIHGELGVADPEARDENLRRLSGLLGTPLVEIDGEAFTAIVPGSDDAGELKRLVDESSYLAGISRAYPATEIDCALPEAIEALAASRLRRESVVAGGKPRGILSLMSGQDASAYANRLLAPLDACRARDSGELLVTLRSWLANHGSWDRTAVALGVHRNTVRHRINQIAGLLDRDLGDPDVRMELWFALQCRSRII
ncbi:PucR family transcriptional regulator [Micromonospora sp. NPDC048830]|uniref:PucR family transcriptional regulator n=1 Tax=Micromonospora sp. NPDC048830 TaxID=3364257 RepID=UPI00371EDE38